ncbi:hypothetical protein HDU76_007660 [Blyttiomyces sp. JEL0837]|nr:hypothetical protein HDU76_007660 [Blyttiomyces sp. JEL0837]
MCTVSMHQVTESLEWELGMDPFSNIKNGKGNMKAALCVIECNVQLISNKFPEDPVNLIAHLQDFVALSVLKGAHAKSQSVRVMFQTVYIEDDALLQKLTSLRSPFNLAVSLRPMHLFTLWHERFHNHLIYPIHLYLVASADSLDFSYFGVISVQRQNTSSQSGIAQGDVPNSEAQLLDCKLPPNLNALMVGVLWFLKIYMFISGETKISNPSITKLSIIKVNDPDICGHLEDAMSEKKMPLRLRKLEILGLVYDRIEFSDLFLLAEGPRRVFQRLDTLALDFSNDRGTIELSGPSATAQLLRLISRLKSRSPSIDHVYFRLSGAILNAGLVQSVSHCAIR